MYYDLTNDKYIEKKEQKSLKFLYNTIIGRFILKFITKSFISKVYAIYMNSSLSKHKIRRFIKKNNIDINDYEQKEYKSFNDFFIRNIKENKRSISQGLIAVCDSKLSAYKINNDSTFNIKNSTYTIEELIKEKNHKYKYALIFRLGVTDYHHYIFPDDGKTIKTKTIKGILHTVQPIAFKKYKVFHENTREVSFLNCENLGNVCYIEVGAMFVGKIVNKNKTNFKKGEEKGHFEFGGSTVILLIEKDIKINKKILENTKKDIETIVKMGQNISL